MFSRTATMKYTKSFSDSGDEIKRLADELDRADAVVIGAGSGLSTSAGFTYTGERFRRYFGDFIDKYGFRDMYSGGFYPFKTPEEHWAYWSRYIYINRYTAAPKPVYDDLLKMVQYKDYFVLTTNVDHQFQKAGFDKESLFYTQGDYGLWQCSVPCCDRTYDNKDTVRIMVAAQGFDFEENGSLYLKDGTQLKAEIPSGLVPFCPVCGRPVTMNLRVDSTFVEDEGWRRAARRYEEFIGRVKGRRTLYLELGAGMNTPGIVKFSFWRMTAANPQAVYACINYGEACAPREIADRSICINGDIGEVLKCAQYI